MTFDDIYYQLQELADQFELKEVTTNLDPRVGTLWTDEDRSMIATMNRRQLDYYGGFEYIPPEYVLTVGHWTLYSAEHDRVADALEFAQCTE